MNHILRLQANLDQLKADMECIRLEVESFIVHLNSDKFRGTDNGERKDWIATADVMERLRRIQGFVQGGR